MITFLLMNFMPQEHTNKATANRGFKKLGVWCLGVWCLMERSFCIFDFTPNGMVREQKSPTS